MWVGGDFPLLSSPSPLPPPQRHLLGALRNPLAPPLCPGDLQSKGSGCSGPAGSGSSAKKRCPQSRSDKGPAAASWELVLFRLLVRDNRLILRQFAAPCGVACPPMTLQLHPGQRLRLCLPVASAWKVLAKRGADCSFLKCR